MTEPIELPARPDLTSSESPGPASEPSPASLGDRLLAQLVDGLVAFGLFFFVGMTVAPRFGGAMQTGFDLSGRPAAVVIAIVSAVMLAYFVLAEGSLGVTFGKAVAGIRVQTLAGGRIGLRAALVRNLMRVIDGIGVYLVGAITILVTGRRQRLGDLAARTVVVTRERGRALPVAALVVALALAAGGIAGGLYLRPGGLPTAAQKQPGQPRFATVIMTDDQQSKTEKTVFSADTSKVYVVFTLADVPEDTLVRALWIAEQVEGLPANDTVGEYEVKAGGPLNRGNFSLSRPDNGWAAGTYRVELYLAGQLAHTARFRIEGP
ncbi:MAG: RDD family protein [Armatimonadetes bacterium]|nr:RDD family protein [Armatimonadota bacterium]